MSRLFLFRACHALWAVPFLLLVCGLSAQEAGVNEASPENTAPVRNEWKLMAEDSVSMGFRVGSVLWSGMDWPAGTGGAEPNIDGINGKNFLYPVIPVIGLDARIGLGPTIRLQPSLDLYVDEYVYRSDLDRAFRTTGETGNMVGPVATVFGFLVSVPLWFDIPLSDRVVLSLAPGLAFFPRVAVMALDNSTGIEVISEALNRDAKWLYPETGIAISYALGSWFSAGFQLQVMYPIYHAWSQDGLSFSDGLILMGTFGFDFFL